MSNEEELVVFMTLPFGVQVEWNSPAGENTWNDGFIDDMSRFKFPPRALKMPGERWATQNGLENSWKREMKVDLDIGVRIDVEKQACHQLSHVEIGGGKRIYQQLSHTTSVG